MTFLTYSLAAIIAFSGLIVGSILALRTKEEMPTAKKYFPLLQKILYVAIIAVFLNHFKVGIIIKVIIYAIVIFAILRAKVLNSYFIIAVFFFFLGQSEKSLFMISLLVFLYGFPTGSLLVIYSKKMKWPEAVKKIILKHGIFLVVAIGLQFLYATFVLKTLS